METTYDIIRGNIKNIESIIMFPGTLKELNSCQDTQYRMVTSYHLTVESTNRYWTDVLRRPSLVYKQSLFENGFRGVVRFSSQYIVDGNSVYAIFSGIAIKPKEKWWKKYVRRNEEWTINHWKRI